MKRIVLALFFLLTFPLASFAQDVAVPEDRQAFLDGFTYLVREGRIDYYVNDRHVSREGGRVAFFGFYFIDERNFGLSKILIDCFGFTWTELERRWFKDGVRFNGKGHKAVAIKTGRATAWAHRKLCGVVV